MTASTPTNPLGLNISFLFGRGYLHAEQERLSDWITLESLKMEIPDLQFPFDARGGLHRFRNTRCLVREIELSISEASLQSMLATAAEHIDGFKDLRVRFLEDAIHVSLRLGSMGADAYVSFRVALIPPEPPHADELDLSLYDYRAYGPMPHSPRLIAYELMTSLLGTPTLRPPGRGKSFTVSIAGDILRFRPLKILLLNLFPRVGWKLPNLSDVVLEGARVRPGRLTLRASTRDSSFYASESKEGFSLAGTQEGARALAAYEAKDLFAAVDQAIFDGEQELAMERLATHRDAYGLHPELMARTLEGLLARPTPAHLAEADAICQELVRENPEALHAFLARPSLAQLEKRSRDEVLAHYDRLAELLRKRNDLEDWILCSLAGASLLMRDEPRAAATRLREILKLSPRDLVALESLRTLYEELGDWVEYEEVLKRLTGVYTDRASLKQAYLELATHLMHRRGQITEARVYLEKVLRLAPDELGALHTLGESYVLSEEPLRAVKAFGSAARAAEARGKFTLASQLQVRIARLWHEQLSNASDALLSARRALQLFTHTPPKASAALEHVDILMLNARLHQECDHHQEALSHWIDVLQMLPRLREEEEGALGSGEARRGLATLTEDRAPVLTDIETRMLEAHRQIAWVYEHRGRPDAAAGHWHEVLDLDAQDPQATHRLETYYRQSGRPEQLINFLLETLERAYHDRRRQELRRKLADLYASLHMIEEAREQLDALLLLDPKDLAAREQLISLLRSHQRFETLRESLQTLLLRLTERDERADVLLEIGELQLEHLRQPRQATRAFFEALDIRPSQVQVIERARLALDDLIALEGRDTPAPVGKENAASLLERVLQRIVDMLDAPEERAQALDEIADLATWRGDEETAKESRRRAASIRDAARLESTETHARIDDRLDALLGPDLITLDMDRSDFAKPEASAKKSAPDLSEMLANLPNFHDLEVSDIEPLEEAEPEPEENKKHDLSAFRNKMRDLFKRPGKVDGLLKDAVKKPRKLKLPTLAEQEEDELEEMVEVVETSEAMDAVADIEVVEVTSEDPMDDFELVELVESTEAVEDAGEAMALMSNIDAARQGDDPRRLANALQEALDLSEQDPNLVLPEAQLLAMRRELGEVLFYDLEEAEASRPHLEYVRDKDPQGLGAEVSVVNALESIYEDSGAVDARIRLLQSRLEQASNPDLANTFRLLIAQLQWDERHDRKQAEETLAPLFAQDPNHEAAHRLSAQIARGSGDFEAAAAHLESVLNERSGGLDEVELERDLADLYLRELEDPGRARPHYERVLQEAPADAGALDGVKSCQHAESDWAGFLESLTRELGMLVGGAGLDVKHPDTLLPHAVPDALRPTAAQIVAEAARITQDRLDDDVGAYQLWGAVLAMWSEHFEALEHRVTLGERLQEGEALAQDLELLADLLLDQHERFATMTRAAALYEGLGAFEPARRLYAEAIAMVDEDDSPPDGLDRARRALQALQSE